MGDTRSLRDAVIVAVARTPIGKFRQSLSGFTAEKLGALAANKVVGKAGIDPIEIDEVLIGNLLNSDRGNIARVVCLEAGFPISVPAITMDRQCSSSLNALAYGALLINTGNADVILAGGVESYSQQPFYLERPSTPFPTAMEFLPKKLSVESIGNPSMIVTAENLAEEYHLTRHECDEFALRSHTLAAKAWNNHYFDNQVFSVSIPQKKGEPKLFEVDECVRFDSSYEALAKLKPVIKADGIVTAGNASPMNDGASMVLLMSRERAKSYGLDPLGVVKEFASAGVDPNIMGIGPVYATRKLLKKTGLKIEDMDLIEINEAFAAQSIPCVRELGVDMDKLNVDGGAIAIGHPNAASGGVLVARLIYAMRRKDVKRGLISFCCGGGQGFSQIIERD